MPFDVDRPVHRAYRLIQRGIERHSIELSGLTVFTEAATGPYRFTPMLCALAGAQRVYGLARDTRWSSARDAILQAQAVAREWEVDDRIEFVVDKKSEYLAEADIVTNSGNVRPIDREAVSVLKPTCVIPLMWETWEHRAWELDMDACREKGILVMGTDEEAIDYRGFTGMVHVRMLLQSGLEVHGNRVLVLSSDPVRRAICSMLEGVGADFCWTSLEYRPGTEYAERFIAPDDRSALLAYAATADACICDDRRELGTLIGPGGLFSAGALIKVNPDIRIINRSGIIDYTTLKQAGIHIHPDKESASKYPNTTAADLGILPIMELVSAGLKVGEVMARARLGGMSVVEAARYTLGHAPAMDFENDGAWIPKEASDDQAI